MRQGVAMRLRPATDVVGQQAKEAKEAMEAKEGRPQGEARPQGARKPQLHLTSMLWQNKSPQY